MNNQNLTTDAKKSNSLIHKIDLNSKNVNAIIKIRLNDECKNGHQDFSITATFWEIRNDKNMIADGCCHGEILKHLPNLQIFVNLHLCDYNGAPMYPEANGFYHLINGFNNIKPQDQNFLAEYCEYYRITADQFEVLKTAKEQDYFGYLLHSLGILNQWEQEAKKAIIELEKLTGNEFLIDSKRTQFNMSDEQLQEVAEKVKQGYYTIENMEQRETEKQNAKKQRQFEQVVDKFHSLINELKNTLDLMPIKGNTATECQRHNIQCTLLTLEQEINGIELEDFTPNEYSQDFKLSYS